MTYYLEGTELQKSLCNSMNFDKCPKSCNPVHNQNASPSFP